MLRFATRALSRPSIMARSLCVITAPFEAVTVADTPVMITVRRPPTTYTPVTQPKTARGVADMTGLKVWASAYRLIEHLQRDSTLSNKTILELGSGTGIVGIAAAVMGAKVLLTDPGREVNFTQDHAGNTMERLKYNMQLNADAHQGRASAAQLLWGQDEHIDSILKHHQRDTPAQSFDLIIGSDLLYQHTHYHALLHTLQRFVSEPPHPLIILAFKTRHGGEERFLKCASEPQLLDGEAERYLVFDVTELPVEEGYRLVELRARFIEN